jgi:hypothetical protein
VVSDDDPDFEAFRAHVAASLESYEKALRKHRLIGEPGWSKRASELPRELPHLKFEDAIAPPGRFPIDAEFDSLRNHRRLLKDGRLLTDEGGPPSLLDCRALIFEAASAAVIEARAALQFAPEEAASCASTAALLLDLAEHARFFSESPPMSFSDALATVTGQPYQEIDSLIEAARNAALALWASVDDLRPALRALSAQDARDGSPPDVLTTTAIDKFAVVWRRLTANEPGRSRTGPFARFVIAAWKTTGLSVPGSSANDMEGWLGRKVERG